MARALVTQDAVSQISTTLVQEGVEPSIINIQARIGGGSYTTVKRYLDEWRKLQAAKPAVAVEIPTEILGKAEIGLRSLWLAALALAHQEAQKATGQALAETQIARRELTEALTELARVEQVEAEYAQALDDERAQRRELELRIAALEVEVRHAALLQTELETVRAELGRARQESAVLREQTSTGSLHASLADLQEQVAGLLASHRRDGVSGVISGSEDLR
jgi:hypothetical protein